MGKVVTLGIKEIHRPSDLQMREKLDMDHVENMVEALKAGSELPAVEVVKEGNVYWLVDGWHRMSAHDTVGSAKVKVEVVQEGSREDARWLACAANRDHTALIRSRDDKRKAVRKALECWPHKSSRAIAQHVGVGHHLVEGIRPKASTGTGRKSGFYPSSPDSETQNGDSETREGVDGKKRSTKKKATKKKATKKKATKKSGSEVLGPKDRKAAYTSLGKVIRILDGTPLWSDAMPHLYAVNDLLEKAGK